MTRSIESIGYLIILMLLFVFIYALIGVQSFGMKWKDENNESPRINFDNFGWSLVGIFIIISGENWNEIMY